MGEAKTELLRGTLDMLILKVVALGPSHGYAIAQRLQQISKDFFQVHQGSLYPALHRLEDRGWLQAEWKESETGREAKFYALTTKGRRQMDAEVVNWERLCDAVGLVLRLQKRSPSYALDSPSFSEISFRKTTRPGRSALGRVLDMILCCGVLVRAQGFLADGEISNRKWYALSELPCRKYRSVFSVCMVRSFVFLGFGLCATRSGAQKRKCPSSSRCSE
jgi:transcriptional regulator